MNKICFFIFFQLVFFTNFIHSFQFFNNDCQTKLVRVYEPLYPNTIYQGYSIVNFDIDTDSSITNIKATKSMCATSRNDNGEINFKTCPFFKPTSVAAAKFLKFNQPKDSSGKSCKITNAKIKYNYSLYNFKIINDNFLLRKESDNDNTDIFLEMNEKNFDSYEDKIYEVNTVR